MLQAEKTEAETRNISKIGLWSKPLLGTVQVKNNSVVYYRCIGYYTILTYTDSIYYNIHILTYIHTHLYTYTKLYQTTIHTCIHVSSYVESQLSDLTVWPETQKLFGHDNDVICLCISNNNTNKYKYSNNKCILVSACKAKDAKSAVLLLWDLDM